MKIKDFRMNTGILVLNIFLTNYPQYKVHGIVILLGNGCTECKILLSLLSDFTAWRSMASPPCGDSSGEKSGMYSGSVSTRAHMTWTRLHSHNSYFSFMSSFSITVILTLLYCLAVVHWHFALYDSAVPASHHCSLLSCLYPGKSHLTLSLAVPLGQLTQLLNIIF